MTELDILIPSRNEMFLSKTIEDILGNIEGNTEIIAVCDGNWPDPPVVDNPKVHLIYHSQSIGQRAATNEAAKISRAKFIMKVDAHCAFDKGFDKKMMEICQYGWTAIPRQYNLHAFDWICKCGQRIYQGPTPVKCEKCGEKMEREMIWKPRSNTHADSMMFDSSLHFQYWKEYSRRREVRKQGDIVDTMSLLGACWMMHRDRYWELGGMDEDHGSWGQMGTEIACKTWLSGGRLVVYKKTWYAHMFRTQGGDFGFPYTNPGIEKARRHSRSLWLEDSWPKAKYPLSWLIKKFAPVPTWGEGEVAKIAPAIQPAPSTSEIGEFTDEVIVPIPKTEGQVINVQINLLDVETVKQCLKDHPEILERIFPKPKPTKGLCYYTDNQLDPVIMEAVQTQLMRCCNGYPIISVSLEPMRFGGNIFLELKRGHLTMAKQQLAGLEALNTDIVFMCFQGNTYVETISGLKRIDKIRVGELVKTHLGRFRIVEKVFERKYKQREPLIEISTPNSVIRCTPEHPFYVYRNGGKEWIAAKSLITTDLLLYPQEHHQDYVDLDIEINRKITCKRHIGKTLVDEDFARFMGLYVAEGHYNGKNGIGFTFNNGEKELQEFVKNICFEKFSYETKMRSHWSTQVLVNIHDLGIRFKEWFGENARTKHIPNFIFDWNLRNRLSFILGLLQGDGSWHKRGGFYVGLTSASKKLIQDIVKLMNESGIGWDNKIKERENKRGFAKNSQKIKMEYPINLSKKSYTKMMDILSSVEISNQYIGISISRITTTKMSPMPKFRDNKRISYKNCVYNLQVEEDNSYIVQSAIVHNCEHDVLYPCDHFDFTPPRKDVFYYNLNWWKVRTTDGQALHFKAKQVSGLCAYREILVEYFRNRVQLIESGEIGGRRHFEPGGRNYHDAYAKLTTHGFDTWMSKTPYVDIRHEKVITRNIFDPSGYRNQVVDWTLQDFVPGWGKTKGRFNEFLKETTDAIQAL